MKFKFEDDIKWYDVTDISVNNDGTVSIFSKDYCCGLIAVIYEEDNVALSK